MNLINEYIVKITTGEGDSSGFIHSPSDESDYMYIFTARHALLGENATETNMPIEILFFDRRSTKYVVTPENIILNGKNNDTEDIAAIIIPKNVVRSTIDFTKTPRLVKLTGEEKSCFINGIPKVTQNVVQRTLYQAQLLSDKDYPAQIQVLISDPVSGEYNSGDLIEGYSGSPICFNADGINYACGIFSKYEDQTKRVLAVDFSLIQALVNDIDLPKLELIQVETDLQIIADIKKIRTNTLRVLNRIKDQIGQVKLSRAELTNKLCSNISESSVIVVSGRAGIGKSAITKNAIMRLEKEYEIIAFQGEQLDKPSIPEIFATASFDLTNDFQNILNSCGVKSNKIILVDSIEKILETSNADTIIDFFVLLRQRPDLKIILSCRSYAVEAFNIRFLQQFPEYKLFEVPLLSDDELGEISLTYPFINSLLSKSSLKRILQIPFNLDKATIVESHALEVNIDSESDFKNIMWQYVIENKQKEPDVEVSKERGIVFSKIALGRARQMTPYVIADTEDISILQQLASDNIIEPNPLINNQFTASHDIFEDWALTKFIDEKYQEYSVTDNGIEDFYLNIGYAPAIRRAFRIWVSEKLQNIDYNTEMLLKNTLTNLEGIQQYWKDEVLIAVIQSSYNEIFLSRSVQLLSSNNFGLFKRAILLLNVACQKPDFSYLKSFNEDQRSQIYHGVFLKPVGTVWGNMVNFISNNINDLESQFSLIIPFLLQWQKSLPVFGLLPGESRNVGLILMKYFEYIKKKGDGEYLNRRDNIEECVRLVLKLSPAIKEEVKVLLENALGFNRRKRDADDYVSEKVIKNVLSYFNSSEVCVVHPSLVLKIAEKEWFYIEPSQEEVNELLKGSPFKSIPRGLDKNEEFGVTRGSNADIFPANTYQIPTLHLLRTSTEKTLEFICKLFNHSLLAYLKSDFLAEDSPVFKADPRKKIEIELPDGKVITQYGSLTLWLMYRGTHIATPYLLQSVLMALEDWLLSLSSFVEKKGTELDLKNKLSDTFNYLLIHSNSVAITSVLVSVATAYPNIFAENVLPLFKVKEFYSWDLARCHYESSALTPLGSREFAKLMQEQRYKSNQLPHRKLHFESLFLKLSLGHYGEKLIEILDEFYAENPTNQAWKFTLNRIDKRKLEIIKEVEDGFVVQTKIDEDLQPVIKEAQKQLDIITPLSRATNWGLKVLEKETGIENNGIDEWRVHYNNVLNAGEITGSGIVYYQPAVIAAVGISNYFDFLTEEELKWCVDLVFAVINHEIKRSANPYDVEFDSTFGAFESEPSFVALVHLVYKSKAGKSKEAKELLFVSLLFIHNELDRKKLTVNIKSELWANSPGFMLACIIGLIEYSKISHLRIRIAHFRPEAEPPNSSFLKRWYNFFKNIFSKKKNNKSLKEKLIDEYNGGISTIIDKVINENNSFNFNDFQITDGNSFYLIEALSFVPYDTEIEILQEFCSLMIRYIFDSLGKEERFQDDKVPYQLRQVFQKHMAKFFLSQPPELALNKFKELFSDIFKEANQEIDYSRKEVGLLKGCLEELISSFLENHSYANIFWLLWEYLAKTIHSNKIPYFSELILLDYMWINHNKNEWFSLSGKKDLFESLILNLGKLKSSVRLLSGIGFTELMPDGVLWLSKLLEENELAEEKIIEDIEKLVINIFYDKVLRNTIRNNTPLRNGFIKILDKLIDQSSASAFLIRDDFISLN